MTAFTRNISKLNRGQRLLEESLAAGLEANFPRLEHAEASPETTVEAFEATGPCLLVPLNDSPAVRAALESLLGARLAGGAPALVVDLDIAAPHDRLLGVTNDEGLSDHFLYGISRDKLLRDSSAFPSVRVITPGTFTPRAADIYRDKKWKGLLDWLANSNSGQVIVIAPTFRRFQDLAPLAGAGALIAFPDPDQTDQAASLPGLFAELVSRTPEATPLRVIWASLSKEPEPAAEKTPADESVPAAAAPLEEAAAVGPEKTESLAGPEIPEESESLPEEPFELEVAPPEEAAAVGPEKTESLAGPEIPEESESIPEEPIELEVTPQPSAAPDSPAGGREDEEEIFLPDELLFLDEDSEKPSRTGAGKSFEAELEDLGMGELPDLKEPAGEPLPALAEPTVSEAERSVRPEVEAQELEEASIEETSDTPARALDEIPGEESEAIFRDPEAEEELAAAEAVSGAPDVNDSQAERALEQMKGFEETLNSPEEEEDLVLDTDPLSEFSDTGADMSETAQAAGELEDIAAEPLPGDATGTLPEEAAEALPGEELEALTEAEVEALPGEGMENLTADETGSLPGEEPEITPDEVAETLPGEEMDAPAEEEIQPLSDLDIEEIEPHEMDVIDQPGESSEPVLEESSEAEPAEAALEEENPLPEDTDAVEPQLEELDDEGQLSEKVPSAAAGQGDLSSDVEDLLAEDTGLDLDTDIDLGAVGLGEIKETKAKPVKKKKKKKSGTHPLAWITLLLVLTGGLFYLWKQGTVSSIVRQNSTLSGLINKAGITLPQSAAELEQKAAAERAAAAAAAATAESVPAAPTFETYEYSIQVGSYRFLPQALEAREQLEKSGMKNVFVSPVILDSLGSWNRLYVGLYTNSSRADTAMLQLMPDLKKTVDATNLPGLAIKRRTPWAIKVGDFSASDSLDTIQRLLANNDIPSYRVALSPDSASVKNFRLYVGAFEQQDQAVFIRSRLFDIGVNGSIEEREGPVGGDAPKPKGKV